MIVLGREEPVIDPRTWVEMEGFGAPCDRCLFVFWGRPFDIAKSVREDVVEESKLRIPALKGAWGRYRDTRVCVYRLYIGAPAATIAMELLIAAGIRKFLVFSVVVELYTHQ